MIAGETMSDAAALFLGVDGGASRTRAVLVDGAGNVRGRGEAGGANQSSVGVAGAGASVRAATDAALHAAGAGAKQHDLTRRGSASRGLTAPPTGNGYCPSSHHSRASCV